MAIRKVSRMGHPVLRKVAETLTAEQIKSPEIKRLIEDMKETMREYTGIGIAAPQVHESVQLALIELPPVGEEAGQGLTVFINPKIKVLDEEEQGFWEGCLSVPELRGLVYRPRKVEVSYLDENAQPKKLVAEDFLATVVQHELDHLEGILFVDRIEDMSKLAFLEEYQRYCIPRPGEAIGELGD